ncbi:MAG: PrgI family protein [Candidatus Pacebacteria bacterium]|nr:PrgI family protein [Candidatus Paceibacterota bacterium]
MQFEVPQFIDIEDKIFGPLTWRQFLYLGGGIGMGVVLFFIAPFIVFLLIGLPLAILAGALAFYPVNNRPFSFFLEAIFNYLGSSKLYLWRKKNEIVHRNMFIPNSIDRQTPETDKQSVRPNPGRNVNSLARRLELEALQKKE